MKKVFLVLLLIFINIASFSDVEFTSSSGADDNNYVYENGVCYGVYESSGQNLSFIRMNSDGTSQYRVSIVDSIEGFNSIGNPVIYKDSTDIYVLFVSRGPADSVKKVYFSKSTDSGNTFTAVTKIMPASGASDDFTEVKITKNGTYFGLAMIGTSNVNNISKVYIGSKTSMDSFSAADSDFVDVTVSLAANNSTFSNLSLEDDGSNYYICFERSYNSTLGIYYGAYTNTLNVNYVLTQLALNLSDSFAYMPDLKIYNGSKYIIFSTGTDLKVVSPGGDQTNVQTSSANCYYPSLVINSDGLYFTWLEENSSFNYKKLDLTNTTLSSENVALSYNVSDSRNIHFIGSTTTNVYYGYSSNLSKFMFGYNDFSVTSGGSGTGNTQITNSIPAAGATDVEIDAGVTIYFSGPVDPDSTNLLNVKLKNNITNQEISCTRGIASNKLTVTLKPTANLSTGTSYNVTVSNMKDIYGGNVQNFTANFATRYYDITSPSTITKAVSYPNPYKGGVFKFNYSISKPANSVKIKVYNLRGKLIKTIRETAPAAGPGDVLWDVTDRFGNALGNGVYIYKIIADFDSGSLERTGKFIISL